LNIRYVSWVGTSGYAVAAQGYLLSLLHAEAELGWTPLFPNDPRTGGWSQAESTEAAKQEIAALCTDEGNPTSYNGSAVRELIDNVPADTADAAIIHIVPEAWSAHRRSEGLTIGNTVWETDKLPAHWPPLLNSVDGIIVPCTMNREVMVSCGVTVPVHVVPHVAPRFPTAPTSSECEAFREHLGIPRDHTVFYCIDLWDPRKAPYKTIAAFLDAFDGDDDVTLIVKTSEYGPRSGAEAGYEPTDGLIAQLTGARQRPANIVTIRGDVPRRAIELLHAVGDCYVSLTHGEGWGIGSYEAVALGNPVVTTGWGGTLDYLGTDWPYLIDFEMVPVMNLSGLPSFDPTQKWAAADREHAGDLMRSIHADPEPARRAAAFASARIQSEFGTSATADRLEEALQP
jgi:glycosyltransferase involved in cell wall biosynthesis